jgi:hypothetical protein
MEQVVHACVRCSALFFECSLGFVLTCLLVVLQVGLVSQEPTLFATRIYENIAQGRPGERLALRQRRCQ